MPSLTSATGPQKRSRSGLSLAVDLQQPVAADAGEQMRRGQKADAAAEIMRTEHLARRQDIARDAGAGRARPIWRCRAARHRDIARPAPAQSRRGLQYSRRPRAECAIVLRNCLPLLPRAIGTDRLLEPGKTEVGSSCGASSSACSMVQPWLTSAASMPLPTRRAQRREIGAVGRRIEADLQFQRAMAARQGRFRHPLATRSD